MITMRENNACPFRDKCGLGGDCKEIKPECRRVVDAYNAIHAEQEHESTPDVHVPTVSPEDFRKPTVQKKTIALDSPEFQEELDDIDTIIDVWRQDIYGPDNKQ
jgi:hypothetical protein